MSLFKRKQPPIPYNPKTQQPAVRRSICTGEMTVGFIDRATGKFTDLMRVDGQAGLEAFLKRIGAEMGDLKEIY